MNLELSTLIQKVTAKTIFDDNIYYMIQWRHMPESQNTWKPSEYFEQTEFLSEFVQKFEEETQLSEERLFASLEKGSAIIGAEGDSFEGMEIQEEEQAGSPKHWASVSNSDSIKQEDLSLNAQELPLPENNDHSVFESYTEQQLLEKYTDSDADLRAINKKKLSVFYELELKEKVFDFRNYGHKVLDDLKRFSDPKRSRRLLMLRHKTLLEKRQE